MSKVPYINREKWPRYALFAAHRPGRARPPALRAVLSGLRRRNGSVSGSQKLAPAFLRTEKQLFSFMVRPESQAWIHVHAANRIFNHFAGGHAGCPVPHLLFPAELRMQQMLDKPERGDEGHHPEYE